MGDLSAHFSSSEFACRGRGRAGHVSHPLVLSRTLVERLEVLRAICGGKPLHIVSGHRCPFWNRSVGGAGGSQHKLGTAADLPAGYCTVAQATAAGFKGIGTKGPWATHVDVRPYPARWRY